MSDNYLLPYTGEQVEDRLESPLPVALGGTGQSAAYQNVALTPDTAKADGHILTCRYYPYLGICLMRGYCKLTEAVTADGTFFNAATIPSGYRPAQSTAITVGVIGGGSGLVRGDGTINLRTFTNRAANTNIDFSGWWFV